jgi:hypothetical protein
MSMLMNLLVTVVPPASPASSKGSITPATFAAVRGGPHVPAAGAAFTAALDRQGKVTDAMLATPKALFILTGKTYPAVKPGR